MDSAGLPVNPLPSRLEWEGLQGTCMQCWWLMWGWKGYGSGFMVEGAMEERGREEGERRRVLSLYAYLLDISLQLSLLLFHHSMNALLTCEFYFISISMETSFLCLLQCVQWERSGMHGRCIPCVLVL